MKNFLNELNEKGFIFQSYPTENIDFSNRSGLIQYFSDFISKKMDIPNESMAHDFDQLKKDEEHLPHFHVIPGSFQVVIWLPEESFEGRYFLFGTSKKLMKVKPKLGYMCFMKPNDPSFIHGASKLLSDNPIESLAFSSLVKHIPGNRDIFVTDYQLSNEVLNIEDLAKT